ncbi:MAG TPA: phosphatase PAP2 family protein [Steroidobacteraceae bacterium]|nr:phosphatase PAP2 family protein [Steroidobacteraceae bacterium]
MQRSGRIASSCRSALALLAALCVASPAAAGGPFGIDHVLAYDDSGIWARSNQNALIAVLLAGEVGNALWEGGEERLGRTLWQSIDATVIGGASSQLLKLAFSRERPDQSPDPNQWFRGHGFQSFPSGEVTTVSAVVTPLLLEYGHDHPAVYALELLPVYDGIARMKVRAHWQSDVLAGFALGSAAGWYAHRRASPLVLSVMPHALYVGLSRSW